MEKQTQKNPCKNGWTKTEKIKVGEKALILLSTQNTYGKNVDVGDVLNGWESLFSKIWGADLFCDALDQWVMSNPVFPAPSDIYKILLNGNNDIARQERAKHNRSPFGG